MAVMDVLSPMSESIATPLPAAVPTKPDAPRAWKGPVIKGVITLALLAYLGHTVLSQRGAESLGETLGSLRWEWLALALAVHVIGTACGIGRWHLLLTGQGIHGSPRFLVGSYLIGRFFGAVSIISHLGFGGWRLYDVGRHTGKVARSAAAIAVEMVVGQLAMGTMVIIASVYGARIIGMNGVLLVNAVFACVIAGGIAFLARPAAFGLLADRLPAKIRVRVRTLADSLMSYRGKSRLVFGSLLLAGGTHATHLLIYVCTARALGVTEIGPGEVFFGSALQILVTMVPPSINGIGLREMTAAALYTSLGVPVTSAVLIASLGFAVEMVVSAIGAPVFLARRAGYQADIKVDDADRERTAHEAIPQAAESEWPKVARGGLVGLGAGTVAGLLVGLTEGATVVLQGDGRTGPWVIAYGAIAYAVFFGLGGTVMLALSAWTGRIMKREAIAEGTAYGHTVAFFAAAAGFGLTLFRIRRDIFEEQLRLLSLQGVGVLLACAVGAGVLYLLLSQGLGALARRAPRVPAFSPAVVAGVIAVVVPVALGIGEPERAAANGAVGTAPSNAGNVLVIVVDTLRADHLPSYGYERGATPNLDAFAADAIRFDQAFANASWTRPSFASIMTGRYPSSHSVMAKSDALPAELVTIGEAFREGGYHTTGVVTNYNIGPYFNFDQGFDEYHYLEPDFILGADDAAAKLLLVQFLRQRLFEPARDRLFGVQPGVAYQSAEVVNREIISLLDAAPEGRPFMLFAGYMDPHDPYYAHPYDGEGYSRAAHPNPDPDEAPHLTALYDGEITYWDQYFGELIAELQRRGLYDDLTIVITADHGEEFCEHGGFFHGTTLYDEQVHVPLFVRLPGGRRSGTVVNHWVQSIDILPTLLRESGLPVPEGVQGGDLFEGSSRLFAEESHEGNVLEAVRERRGMDELKLITANPGNPRHLPERELFRVDRDRGEAHDLSASEPELLEAAELALGEAHHAAAEGAAEGVAAEIGEDELRRLCALGYGDHAECCAHHLLSEAACAE